MQMALPMLRITEYPIQSRFKTLKPWLLTPSPLDFSPNPLRYSAHSLPWFIIISTPLFPLPPPLLASLFPGLPGGAQLLGVSCAGPGVGFDAGNSTVAGQGGDILSLFLWVWMLPSSSCGQCIPPLPVRALSIHESFFQDSQEQHHCLEPSMGLASCLWASLKLLHGSCWAGKPQGVGQGARSYSQPLQFPARIALGASQPSALLQKPLLPSMDTLRGLIPKAMTD